MGRPRRRGNDRFALHDDVSILNAESPSQDRNEQHNQDGSISPQQPRPSVVAIGASAGGLEALEVFFANIASDCAAAFVVIQHLSPDFESHMGQLIQRTTVMPVHTITDGMGVSPGNVYVMPPGVAMTIVDDTLRLTRRVRDFDGLHPIDEFFRSLAKNSAERAMAVILSGTGSDGTAGADEVRRAGGLVVVQDPAMCTFSSMPQSAIKAGVVHLIAAAELMGEVIEPFVRGDLPPDEAARVQSETLSRDHREKVYKILGRRFKLGFDSYKTGTIDRRIHRRAKLAGMRTIDDYILMLEEQPQEVGDLYHDLLIAVTHFFRDREAYDELEQFVIPELIRKHGDTGLRVWVCACCTGEEAYSIAMLILEAIERDGRDIPFKLFATDVDEGSLQFAATGIYSEARMKNVSDRRRQKFFVQRSERFFVASHLRRHIVFAPHDVLTDPPFTHVHLISCRNLLIYISAAAQRKILAIFHFAMKAGSFLWLSPSESLGYFQEEFEVIHNRWKIYRKVRDVKLPPQDRLLVSRSTRMIRRDAAGNAMVSKTEIPPEVSRQRWGGSQPIGRTGLIENPQYPNSRSMLQGATGGGDGSSSPQTSGGPSGGSTGQPTGSQNEPDGSPDGSRQSDSDPVTTDTGDSVSIESASSDAVSPMLRADDFGDDLDNAATHPANSGNVSAGTVPLGAGETQSGQAKSGEQTSARSEVVGQQPGGSGPDGEELDRAGMGGEELDESELGGPELGGHDSHHSDPFRDDLIRNDLSRSDFPRPDITPRVLAPIDSRVSQSIRSGLDLMPVYDTLLAAMMPPSVVCNHRLELLHAFEGSQPFLKFPTGRPSSSILDLVPEPMRNPLSALARQAEQERSVVKFEGLPHPGQDDRLVNLIVRTLRVEEFDSIAFLIQFESVDSRDVQPAPSRLSLDADELASSRIQSLERDLNDTQASLYLTIEQLETNNEELQANNEEMVASNEELQSTNEELQSVNEELYTVNAEHQKRVLELDEANADMKNLLASTRIGVIFLDLDLYIRRFTPEINRILELEPQDVGRNIRGFLRRLGDDNFQARLVDTVTTQSENQCEVRVGQNDYLVRMMPYWRRGEVSGLVVSFVDVSPLRRAESQVTKFKLMADINVDAQMLLDRNGELLYANHSMSEALQYPVEQLVGMSAMRFDANFDRDRHRERFENDAVAEGMRYESQYIRRDGTLFPVEIALTYIELDDGDCLFANIRDITQRRSEESERMLLQKAIETIDNGILITDATHQDNPITFSNAGFSRMTGYTADEVVGRNCRFLQGPDTDPAIVQGVRKAVQQQRSHRSLLLNYRKDKTPFWNDLYLTPVRDENNEVTHFVGVQNDVTERIRIGDQSRINEQTVRSLLDSTAEGIFGLDAEGVCSFCNPSAARLLGLNSVEDFVGRAMHPLIQPVDSSGERYDPADSRILAAIRSGNNATDRDEVFIRADGSPLKVQWWCHPIESNDQVIGAVVTFVDDTERQRFEQELRDARDAANAANDAKSRFLATMSHELRTPLAAILGFAEILQQDDLGEKHFEKLATIRRNGDYLLRLVNDVLDLSRIEVGKFQASPVEVRLDELIDDVRETMNMRTEEYRSKLQFHLRSDLPETITTDPNRLRQILINLIANALKFSPGGRVDVSVEFLPPGCVEESLDDSEVPQVNVPQADNFGADNFGADNFGADNFGADNSLADVTGADDSGTDVAGMSQLRFEVKDTGIGMSPDQMKGLFRPFMQADATIAQRFGGTGLGLSITRRLLEAMHGRVTVQSEKGVGSTFTVTLPVDPCSEPVSLSLGASNRSSTPPAIDDQNQSLDDIRLDARVLIADDMPDVRFIAQHFLTKYGCQVEVVENGQLAVDAVRTHDGTDQAFDLILMDMQMPVLDGVGAVGQIRQAGLDVPVIALTADAMKGTRRRLLDAGFNEYLSKPLDVELLIRAVVSLLDGRPGEDQSGEDHDDES